MRKLLHFLLTAIAMSVVVRAVQQAALTTGGPTQDYAVSGAFGASPKGAIVFGTGGIANGTIVGHSRFFIGLTDGTNHRSIFGRSRDGQSSSSNRRGGYTDRLIWMPSVSATSSVAQASFSPFATDKLTLNWDMLSDSPYLVNAILLGGSDFQCSVVTVTGIGTQNSTTTISGLAFQPEAWLLISRGGAAFQTNTDVGVSQQIVCIGLITIENGTIKQRCLATFWESGVGAGTAKRGAAELDTARCARLPVAGNPITAGATLEYTQNNSDGGIFTTRDAGASIVCGAMAMNFGGAIQGLSLHSRDSKTGTAPQADDFNTPTYPAQAVIGLASFLTAEDTLDVGNPGGTFGFGVATVGEEFSACNTYDVGPNTTVCGAVTNSKLLDVRQDDQTAGLVAVRDSTFVDDQGCNLSYTTTNATARKEAFLVIGRNHTFGKALGAGSSAARAVAKSTHGGLARATAAGTGKSVAKASHAGRGRASSASLGRAVAASTHVGRARAASEAVGKSAGASTHAGRSKAAAESAGRGVAKSTHAGRAKAAAESTGIAQATVSHAGGTTHLGKAVGVGSSVGKAVAVVSHRGRAQAAAQSAGRGVAKKTAAGRSKATGASAAKATARKTAAGRSKATGSSAARSVVHKTAGGRASAASEGVAKSPARSTHTGRSKASAESVSRGIAKHTASGRARAASQSTGRAASLAPTEVLGFYESTSKKVRQRLKAVAGALAIQFSNLPFVEPQGVAWARASVDFDEIQDVQYGSGRASYYVPGELRIDLRSPLREGKKALLDLADALGEAMQRQQVSGVVYSMAQVGKPGDRGDDEYGVELVVPFRAGDSFSRVAGGAPSADDFQGAEAQVRARFRTELPTVTVSYDNLPPTTGATWLRLFVHETPSFDAGGQRRTVGIMEAHIHVPMKEGERAALRLADQIVVAFRLVDAGGVRFSLPYLQGGREVADSWVQPVFCPWSVDHA